MVTRSQWNSGKGKPMEFYEIACENVKVPTKTSDPPVMTTRKQAKMAGVKFEYYELAYNDDEVVDQIQFKPAKKSKEVEEISVEVKTDEIPENLGTKSTETKSLVQRKPTPVTKSILKHKRTRSQKFEVTPASPVKMEIKPPTPPRMNTRK